MSKNRNEDEEKVGGDGEDGLEHAAQQISKTNDTILASLFIEANASALDQEIAENRELFEEKHEEYEFHEHIPDPELLKSIYNSLSNKDIHHKKLLEEGVSPNFIVNSFNRLRSSLNLRSSLKKRAVLSTGEWKVCSMFHKNWRRKSLFYLNDFSSLMELFLRNREKTLNILRFEFGTMFLIMVSSIGLMVLSSRNSYLGSDLYSSWSKYIFSFSLISLILTAIPPFFFFSLWFSNVNHLHTSRNFHIFLFSMITGALIFISLAIFNIVLYYLFN